MATPTGAGAHLVTKPEGESLQHRLASQQENLAHAWYVCREGARQHKRWACHAIGWLQREIRETRQAMVPPTPWWITKQIRSAQHLAQHSGADPWPNCPDPGPRDNQGPGHSWSDTVACENGGSWLDSPGYYRCGLQFDPMWERVYGRLCP
jgi:hypothetical protein